MKFDKKSILIGLSVVVVVAVLLAAGFLLVRGIIQFNDSEVKLNAAKKKLKELYDRKPFPSNENVAREKDNVKLLNEWFDKLTAALRKGQVEPVQKSPSTFMSLLQTKKPELIHQANTSGKVVSDGCGFGFERYFTSSALPEPNDVPRLTQQFTIVEKLCEVLFSEKIDLLLAITREEFEATAGGEASSTTPATTGRAPAAFRARGQGPAAQTAIPAVKLINRSAGILGDEDLYAKFHFILDFKAKEKALWNILNRLSSHEMFIVVTGVHVVKETVDSQEIKTRSTAVAAGVGDGKDKPAESRGAPPVTRSLLDRKLKSAAPAAAAPAAAAPPAAPAPVLPLEQKKTTPPPREERVVCGPDLEKPMTVKIDLDVYRFRGE